MRKTISYEHLLAIGQELHQLEQSGSIIGMFMSSRISEFRDKNGHLLRHVYKEMEKIKRKFVQYEEPGADAPAKPKTTGEGDQKNYVFLEHVTEDDFKKEMSTLLNELVQVIV